MLALLLLQHARRAARTDDAGDLVALEEQDRARWDHALIDEGLALVDGPPSVGPYRCKPRSPPATPRSQTGGHRLGADRFPVRRTPARPSVPVVALNRAVAVAMADGPDAGLRLRTRWRTTSTGTTIPRGPRGSAAGAGREPEAADAYNRALALVGNDAERRYLERRRAALTL